MIRKVEVQFLKKFKDQAFELKDHVVLAGPNNSGKSTLLQAIVIWNMALQKWKARRGPDSKSKAKGLAGISLTRKDFTAVPLREMNMLWTDTQTGLSKDELPEGKKVGLPRVLKVTVEGVGEESKSWRLGFEFRYGTTELIYCKPDLGPEEQIPPGAFDVQVVHIPPFSGIGTEEPRMDPPFQDLLIGQGKAGDILRNLLYEVFEEGDGKDKPRWNDLCDHIENTFGYKLLPPIYAGQPFIQCDYLRGIPTGPGKNGLAQLDIANAGSGFHQVLLLLAFFYARPATVLLMDEPDAHLHVILQEQIYKTLQEIAAQRKCQFVLATHSEVFLNATSPNKILSFYGPPHLLTHEWERDQVREAIKRLPATELLSAERSDAILYVESDTDFNLLQVWAELLGHPMAKWFKENPFWHGINGSDPKEAKGHFFALQSLKASIKGVLLLDGDNRNKEDREVGAEGLSILRWRRYESESYLCHPEALRRYVESRVLPLFVGGAMNFLGDQLPPAVFRNPLNEHDYFKSTPVSKTLLPTFFETAGLEIGKSEYHLVARQMKRNEIPLEVVEKLDFIMKIFGVRAS
jgi:ABC-type dipeptide/oligopeptide/nickel transport system ATPase subunit